MLLINAIKANETEMREWRAFSFISQTRQTKILLSTHGCWVFSATERGCLYAPLF